MLFTTSRTEGTLCLWPPFSSLSRIKACLDDPRPLWRDPECDWQLSPPSRLEARFALPPFERASSVRDNFSLYRSWRWVKTVLHYDFSSLLSSFFCHRPRGGLTAR